MVAWPDLNALRGWMRENVAGGEAEDATQLEISLASATDMIQGRLDAELVDPEGEECPDSVALAIMIRALSLYVRRDSPSGIISFSPDNVIRVNRMDADVDQLIQRYRAIPLA